MTEAPVFPEELRNQNEYEAPRPVLKLRRLSEIKTPPATRWLARGWLPYSEISVLVGEEGLGKSLLWVRFAAHITTGHADAAINLPAREPRDVVVIVTEDNPGEVEARLVAAGADTSRVLIFSAENDGTGNPVFGNTASGGDMATLDAYLQQDDVDAALVVVDAWVDTVAGNLTLKDGQQARQAMHPWKVIAQKHDLAVLLMTHTNRMNTANTRDLMGSTSVLRQKARMVLFAARSPEDKNNGGHHLWVGPDKSNVTGMADAIKYRIDIQQARIPTDDDPGTTARLINPQSSLMTMRNLLEEWQQQQMEIDKKPSKADTVKAALIDLVEGEGGEMPSAELKARLQDQGFGKSIVESAMRDLGESKPGDRGGPWVFTLNGSKSSYSEVITLGTSETSKTSETALDSDITPSHTSVPSLPSLPTDSLSVPSLPSVTASYTNDPEPVRLPEHCQCGAPLTPYLAQQYGACFTCAGGGSND